MQDYFILLLASLLLAGDFAVQKVYQQKSGTGIKAGLIFNTIVGAVTAVLFFVIGGFSVQITKYGLIISTLMSISVFVYTIIGFRILRYGNIALYSLFSLAGAIVVPYIYGTLRLEEESTPLMTVGVILILIATVMSNFTREKTSFKQVLLCISVFLLNGTGAVISKLCQVDFGYGTVDVNDFVCMTGITKFIICAVALVICLCIRRNKNEEKFKFSSVPFIVISAAVGGISYMLQLIGAARLPASLLFPMVSGASMILSALAGVILFKEKLSKWQIAGICISFVGTLFLL